MFVETTVDHDIRQSSIGIPDFTSVRINFPFIDVLHDGYSTFRYAPLNFLDPLAIVAVLGSALYGTQVVPSRFDPENGDSYAFVPGSTAEIYFDAYPA